MNNLNASVRTDGLSIPPQKRIRLSRGAKISKQFSPYAFQHIYQRANDLGVIFYSDLDRIVYYTIDAVASKKYGITVHAASIMFTHTHKSITAKTVSSMFRYLDSIGTSFARMYNTHYGRSGPLFCRIPGIAQKKSSKDKRTNLIYVFNNHVEKKLCTHAEEERWSFLAYAKSNNPYSEPIDYGNISKPLKKSLRLVERRIIKQRPIEYVDLEKILPILNSTEREQFIDYVISHYSLIDFGSASTEFNCTDDMFTAIHASTGSEYSINEDFTSLPDTPFLELIDFAKRREILDKIYQLEETQKSNYVVCALESTAASRQHLEKFFHMKIKVSE